MASVWGELKRRNVVRVGVAYVVVSWLVLQLSDVLMPMLTLPEWVGKFVFFLLLIGFPVALLFAWAFELTPEGLKKEKDVDRSESITHVTGRKLDFVIIGVLVVAVGLLLLDKIYLSEGDTASNEIITTERQSIAVLPFVALSSNQDDEHFSDGLTEELLNSLAQISGLNVAGRTASFSYKGKTPSFQEVGEALGVAHVLEGSVRRAGNELRITAQLIKVDDGFHLWSETYDRTLDDIFTIQEDIAYQVTGALKVALFGEEAESLRQHGTSNAEAQSLYLIAKARLREGRTFGSDEVTIPQNLRSARRLLEEAVKLDPEYAHAWAALAQAYLSVIVPNPDGSGESVDPLVGASLSGEALQHALELAPNLPETQLAKAQWHWSQNYTSRSIAGRKAEIDAAIDAFEATVELAPNSAEVLEAFASVRFQLGEYESAVALYDKAIALDPHSQAQLQRTQSLYLSGRTGEAFREYKRIGALSPDSPWQAGIAQIEYDRGHLHHAILWANNNPEIFFVPVAWASLGDQGRLRASYKTLSQSGGSLADLISIEEMFITRNYSGVAAWFRDSENIVSFLPYLERLFPWVAAVYLRAWPEAESELELFLDDFPIDRERYWGTPAYREFRSNINFSNQISHAVIGIYVAYTLKKTGRAVDAETVQLKSEHDLNTVVARTPKSKFELHQARILVAAFRGQTEKVLSAFEDLVNAGWRHTMANGIYANRDDDDSYVGDLLWFEDSPLLDSVRDEPRFKAVVEKVNAANAAMLAELDAGLTLEDIVDEEFD